MTDISFQLAQLFSISYLQAYVEMRLALLAILGFNLLAAFALGG